jgi:Yip1 domain
MIKALLLIFEGGPAWDRVVLARRGLAFVFFVHLLPMMLIVAAVEGYGMTHWGKWRPSFRDYNIFSLKQTLGYEVAQTVFTLLAVLAIARMVEIMGKTFHGRNNYTQAFTAVVFGLSPMFLFRLLDVAPTMNPYASWLLGIGVSVWILYQGLPRVMMPDPTHAFGLYLSTTLVMFLATGLVRVLTALYLQGNVAVQHSYLGRKLPFLFGH